RQHRHGLPARVPAPADHPATTRPDPGRGVHRSVHRRDRTGPVLLHPQHPADHRCADPDRDRRRRRLPPARPDVRYAPAPGPSALVAAQAQDHGRAQAWQDGGMIEPVTPTAPRPIRRTLLSQSWLDLAFLHWAVPPEAVEPLLPAGAAPDVLGGVTYVGLIAFRMHRIGWGGLPGMPYLGSFPETNVRLYSVDAAGRRGVVFRSLEATRLVPVATARSAFRLPYRWA